MPWIGVMAAGYRVRLGLRARTPIAAFAIVLRTGWR
jgi:hypothetical protein